MPKREIIYKPKESQGFANKSYETQQILTEMESRGALLIRTDHTPIYEQISWIKVHNLELIFQFELLIITLQINPLVCNLPNAAAS